MLKIHTQNNGQLQTIEGIPATTDKAKIWVEVVEPTPEEINYLVQEFQLHELSIEDALNEGHPPKYEDFGAHLFIIVHTPTPKAEESTRKISICLAKDWLITILRCRLPLFDPIADKIKASPARYISSPESLAHFIIDSMLDGFEHQVDELTDYVEKLEHKALQNPEKETMNDIIELRSDVMELVRIVRSQRDVCQWLVRGSSPIFSKKIQPYLRDVYDHTLRVYGLLDNLRERAASARDAYLSTVNMKLTDIMRVLTVIATLMMPLTLVTGIFGMNFDFMPWVKDPLGFWLLLAFMLALAVFMLAWFIYRKWL